MEQSFSGTEVAVSPNKSHYDLPPAQAGLSAALRRAFALPAGESDRQFEELLRKLC